MGEQGIVGLEYLCILVADSILVTDSADYLVMQLYAAIRTSLITLIKYCYETIA